MEKLSRDSIKNSFFWNNIKIKLPEYNIEQVIESTKQSPKWIHFGAGNIFRGYISKIQNTLLNRGLVNYGVIAAETFDFEIIEKIYNNNDNLTILANLNSDGNISYEIIASVTDAICLNSKLNTSKIKEIFSKNSLQMVSFTITEKGYNLKNINEELLNIVNEDISNGPENTKHTMSFVCSMLYYRYKTCKESLALVSMDNCSANGDKLRDSILFIAEKWNKNHFVEDDFLKYLNDCITFPWTMIDKITPHPSIKIQVNLEKLGIENMDVILTKKNTSIAPFVNAETSEYLIIEDLFPNGRPPFEEAGVYMTDRQTVNKSEKMKVTTCLNPLHTALAIFGCLLGYKTIYEEMQDELLLKLIKKIGYDEGMPVVISPKIIDPKEFLNEVIEKRLNNPFMPDTPQRIATDTSQKIPVRYGETLKTYLLHKNLDIKSLIGIPLVVAGWLRYLIGVDDCGNKITHSPDPMLIDLKEKLKNVKFKNNNLNYNIDDILSNEVLFGVDLCKAGLSDKITEMFKEMIIETGAVKKVLKKYLL